MQNKSAIWLFTVLLSLATVYILSFSYVSSRFENEAKDYAESFADSLSSIGMTEAQVDSALSAIERKYLRDSSNKEVYPLFGHTYQQVKEQELNLGLDLQGGMSVTLEVSIPDLVIALSDYNKNPKFRQSVKRAKDLQKSSQDDYITLFDQAWSEIGGDIELWRIFHNMETKDKFPAKSTDEEIIKILRTEAEAAINNSERIIKKRIDQFGVAQPNVQKQSFSGRILVELPGVDDKERVRKQLKSTANLEFWETYRNEEVFQAIADANIALGAQLNPVTEEETPEATEATEEVEEAEEVVTEEVTEDIAEDASTDEPELDLNEGEDVEEEAEEISLEEFKKQNPLYGVLQPNRNSQTAIVGFALASDTSEVNRLLAMEVVKSKLPADLKLLWSAEVTPEGIVELYAIRDLSGKGKARLDGSSIVDSRVDYNEFGEVVVSMTMDSEKGTPTWAQMTEEAANDNKRAIAIVMDDLVYSAPTVNEKIPSGRSQISMGSASRSAQENLKEAESLSGLLKAGSLPAPARIVDEYIVGPTLGEANINSGLMSFAIALMVILLYMVFYYKGAGMVSNIALIANLFFLIGALASLHAALTLPGIAGIVLTIGMAVDANVLIYERIREEMRHGKGLALAVKDGYAKAYSAIVDANITTLLTAIVLFIFGTGPIRGFATTLIIGIFTSLFSAIIITRLIFFNRLEKKKNITFSSNITKNWFTNVNFQFVKKRKTFYLISGVIIIAGIASLSTKGLDYGVDFSGGSSFNVEFQEEVDIDALRASLSTAFSEEGKPTSPIVQAVGSRGVEFKIVTNYMINSEAADVDEQINDAMVSGVSVVNPDFIVKSSFKVDPTISDDFRSGARNATIFSLIIIFLYILFRFRKWQYGLGALIAMTHDVIIVLSLFSIFKGILPFTMEINQAFIAAILTVIGYSINDTVVVFDRIREYLGLHKKDDQKEVINKALNSTLSRTINTSLSTFVVLLMIFIFGGDDIKGFTFALMVGVVVGTYSSIFIATPSVIDFSKKDEIGA